jgi:hypothetical protein
MNNKMSTLVFHEGRWFKILAKPYEPERQTNQIAWMMIRDPKMTAEEAYRKYYETLRSEVKVLCPSFKKEDE